MSSLFESLGRVKVGVWQFWRIVTDTNRDLPFEDFTMFVASSSPLVYQVGANQIAAHGDQKKYFVSKSTLIYSTEDNQVVFNSLNNVPNTILAGVWYEFKSNIYQVEILTPPSAENEILFYFEGVMVDESRRPE